MVQQYSFTEQLKALWRFKWIIVLVALIAGGTALGFAINKPTGFTATATVMIETGEEMLTAIPSNLKGGLELTYLQDVNSQIEVIRSQRILEKAIKLLEPEKAADPSYLQLEVMNLRSALMIEQVGNTNLIAITLFSQDPDLAEKQANAIAEAYVIEGSAATTANLEAALDEINQQLIELRKSVIDLSINPLLNRLTSQIGIALPALESSLEYLERMMTVETIFEKDIGTSLTATQLSMIKQQINSITEETNELASSIQNLSPLSSSTDFTTRSIDIATIESHTRALVIKIRDLSTRVNLITQVEVDSSVKDYLLMIDEQLQIASTTSDTILNQVIMLYPIQQQYQSSSAAESSQYIESNNNQVNRIVAQSNFFVASLEAAAQIGEEVKPRTTNLVEWQFNTSIRQLYEKVYANIETLQEISLKLQPQVEGEPILINRDDLYSMEIKINTLSSSLASLLSDIQAISLSELDPKTTSELNAIEYSINLANYSTKKLGDSISLLAETGSDAISYSTLNTARQQIQLSLLYKDISSTSIVNRAIISSSDNVFTRYGSVFLAVIVGILLSSFLILIYQHYDRTVRDASKVINYTGLALLSNIAKVKWENANSVSILNESIPYYLDSFRLLRTNLALDWTRGQVVLVTSPGSREGKTNVAANLARAFALQGLKVLLIDGNLRNPEITKAFDLTEKEGLADLLTNNKEPWDYLVEVDGVSILPSEPSPTISAELLSSPRLKSLLDDAREIFNVIIIDSAAVIEFADTRILAKDADKTLLVLKMGTSNLDWAMESKHLLEETGTHVAGFALTMTETKNYKYHLLPKRIEG